MIIKHIDFQVIREDYSVYECENGQILKVKHIITDMMNEIDSQDKKTGKIGFNQSSVVITPIPIDTSDYEYLPPSKVGVEHEVRELQFKIIKEIINIYETENMIVLVAPVMEKIIITNKKDDQNNPILRYSLKNTVSTLEKSYLKGEDLPDSDIPAL